MGRRCGCWGNSTITVMAVGCALLAAGASVAQGAHPRGGAVYRGRIDERLNGRVLASQPITFRVSRDGLTVFGFQLHSGYPVYCRATGEGNADSTTARVSRAGLFIARLPIYVAGAHQLQGQLILTGTFESGGRETGNAVTGFTIRRLRGCNGTAGYSTRG